MSFSKDLTGNAFVEKLRAATPARIGIGHAGGRYPTKAQLKFKEDLAISRDAVRRDVPETLIHSLGLLKLKSRATRREDYLMNTSLGRFLDDSSVQILKKEAIASPDVQIVTSDGLSSEAFEKNIGEILPLFSEALAAKNVSLGTPLFVRWGRVAVMDHIGDVIHPKATILFIGERPGLGISDSLSAYFEYEPCAKRVESDRNVLSNIHRLGMPPTESALMLADAIHQVLTQKKSGMSVRFDFT